MKLVKLNFLEKENKILLFEIKKQAEESFNKDKKITKLKKQKKSLFGVVAGAFGIGLIVGLGVK